MFLNIKNIKNVMKVFILFFLIINIYQELSGKDSICSLVILFDNDDTERDKPEDPLVSSLAQAIYQKQSPILCSGYTLRRYFKNMVMKKTLAIAQKNKTYEQLDEAMKRLPSELINFKHLDGRIETMTNNKYITEHIMKNLQPEQWIFRDKAMQLTADQWFIFRKKNTNLFMLVAKAYLLSKGTSDDFTKIGLDVSDYTNVTPQTERLYSALPETDSDFDANYHADLQPPADPKKPESKITVDDIKKSLLPGVSPDKYKPEEERFLWVIYLEGHGSSTGTAQQSQADYKKTLDAFDRNVTFFQQALEQVRRTGGTITYTTTNLTTGVQKKIAANKAMLEKELAQAKEAVSRHKLGYTGLPAETVFIAGFVFNDFQKLLSVLSTHVNTLFLFYTTCFAGGYNRAFVGEVLKNIMANFMVAVGALTDQVVSSYGWKSWHLLSTSKEPLKLGFKLDLEKYFSELSKYFSFNPTPEAIQKKAQKKASLENALRSVTWLSEGVWMNDAPFVRLPNGDTFSASKLNKEIYHLSNVDAKVHALENKEFDFSKCSAVFLSAPYITVPVTLSKACLFSIMPPPVQKDLTGNLYIAKDFVATHYFQTVTRKHTFNEALARNFLEGLGVYKKRFLIEIFHCKDPTLKKNITLRNLVITANRSETGTATIAWTEDSKGYRKTFDLKERERTTVSNKLEYDIQTLVKTIEAAPTTDVSQDSIQQEFNALKKAIKPDVLDTEKVLSSDFFKTHVKRIQKDPNTIVDPATGKTWLHEAVEVQSKRLISMLLQRGADITKKDKNGRTAFDLAKESGNPEIINIFLFFHPELGKKSDVLENLVYSLQKLRDTLSNLAKTLRRVK